MYILYFNLYGVLLHHLGITPLHHRGTTVPTGYYTLTPPGTTVPPGYYTLYTYKSQTD